MRRFFLGAALLLAMIPMDVACSNNEDGEDNGSGTGDGDGDIDISMGGNGIGDGDGDGDSSGVPACPSFVGLSSCEEQGEAAGKREVNLLLVIDKSGSMDDTGGFASTKWETMKAALEAALQDVQLEINVGLSLYPFPDNDLMGIDKDQCSVVGNCCEMPEETEPNIPIGPGVDTVPLIIDDFDRIRPGGGTPTSTALNHAHDYFVNGSGKDLTGDKFVVLATDGGPNCNENISCESSGCTLNIEERDICEKDGATNCCTGSTGALACLDDDATQDAVSRLASAGIDTFVIGIPGSEEYAGILDTLAEEGRRAVEGEDQSYFQVEAAGGVEELTSVFRRITDDLVTSCDIQLSEEPRSLIDVNVAVDCEIVPQFEGGGDGMGGASGEQQWEVITTLDPPAVRLMGSLCDRIQDEGVDRVDVVLGCPPVL